SPTLAGFAVVSHWVPFLVLSVYAGALADRLDCRRLIQASQGLLMLNSLAWAVLFMTGTLRAWHAAAILMSHGLAGVFAGPPIQPPRPRPRGPGPSTGRLPPDRHQPLLLHAAGPRGRGRPDAGARTGSGAPLERAALPAAPALPHSLPLYGTPHRGDRAA